MIETTIICDICQYRSINEQNFLPSKYSTDKFQTIGSLKENISIIISHPNYLNICNKCSREVIKHIFKEQSK